MEGKKVIIVGSKNDKEYLKALAIAKDQFPDAEIISREEADDRGFKSLVNPIDKPIDKEIKYTLNATKINEYKPPKTRAERRKEARKNSKPNNHR